EKLLSRSFSPGPPLQELAEYFYFAESVYVPTVAGTVFVLREINQNLPLTGYRICLQMWRQPPPGRAVVFACKCGASPYRDNKTVRIPDKSKFSGRSSISTQNKKAPTTVGT
ncbi:MAG: hypothetical protein J6B77_08795, partial [Clostridia bacterium]|nr:hypothetical protein [Clostridia bacterium]